VPGSVIAVTDVAHALVGAGNYPDFFPANGNVLTAPSPVANGDRVLLVIGSFSGESNSSSQPHLTSWGPDVDDNFDLVAVAATGNSGISSTPVTRLWVYQGRWPITFPFGLHPRDQNNVLFNPTISSGAGYFWHFFIVIRASQPVTAYNYTSTRGATSGSVPAVNLAGQNDALYLCLHQVGFHGAPWYGRDIGAVTNLNGFSPLYYWDAQWMSDQKDANPALRTHQGGGGLLLLQRQGPLIESGSIPSPTFQRPVDHYGLTLHLRLNTYDPIPLEPGWRVGSITKKIIT